MTASPVLRPNDTVVTTSAGPLFAYAPVEPNGVPCYPTTLEVAGCTIQLERSEAEHLAVALLRGIESDQSHDQDGHTTEDYRAAASNLVEALVEYDPAEDPEGIDLVGIVAQAREIADGEIAHVSVQLSGTASRRRRRSR